MLAREATAEDERQQRKEEAEAKAKAKLSLPGSNAGRRSSNRTADEVIDSSIVQPSATLGNKAGGESGAATASDSVHLQGCGSGDVAGDPLPT